MEVPLVEIFSSVQGEGKYVGCRQVFVRFADCNLRCRYCDTDFNGRVRWRLDDVIVEIERLRAEVPTHSISLTGGEPLLHWGVINELARRLSGAKIFLETNGTLVDELERVIDVIDVVSMDVKLPHSIGRDVFEEHRRFMSIARRKDLYVKVVLDGETTVEEFDRAVEVIGSVSRDILLILQPVTPVKDIRAVGSSDVLKFQARALRRLSDVRVIPQTHRLIGVP